MNDSKRNLIIGIVVIVVVLAIVGYFGFQGDMISVPSGEEEPTGELNSESLAEAPQAVETSQGIVAAPGTSAVATSGQVVTNQGESVRLDVEPGAPQAPQQGNPTSVEELPPQAVKITASASGFSPNEFTVRAGRAVMIAVTGGDTQSHVFAFEDESLSALAVGVAPDETRPITFNAPKAGRYSFFCNIPGHAARGERGVMIVQ